MFSLIGCGSHGRDILAISERCNRPAVALFDEFSDAYPSPSRDLYGFIILGSNYPKQRRQMAERLPSAIPATPLVDPSAIVGPDCQIANGCVIAPLSLLLTDVTLGLHCHLNYGVQMTRCSVGDFTTISPGAVVCGDVTIGEGCLLGASSTVCDRVTIGNNVTVAAGAIIPPCSNVPDGVTVIGVYKD